MRLNKIKKLMPPLTVAPTCPVAPQLMTTLFRIIEPCSGSISIDGIDISRLGLSELRSKLSLVPQVQCILFHCALIEVLSYLGPEGRG